MTPQEELATLREQLAKVTEERDDEKAAELVEKVPRDAYEKAAKVVESATVMESSQSAGIIYGLQQIAAAIRALGGETPTPDRPSAWDEVKRLIAAKAIHRKGFVVGEVPIEFILRNAKEELQELADAPNDRQELADLIGVLMHYAQKQGWKWQDIEADIVTKLRQRFTVGETPRPPEEGK